MDSASEGYEFFRVRKVAERRRSGRDGHLVCPDFARPFRGSGCSIGPTADPQAQWRLQCPKPRTGEIAKLASGMTDLVREVTRPMFLLRSGLRLYGSASKSCCFL